MSKTVKIIFVILALVLLVVPVFAATAEIAKDRLIARGSLTELEFVLKVAHAAPFRFWFYWGSLVLFTEGSLGSFYSYLSSKKSPSKVRSD